MFHFIFIQGGLGSRWWIDMDLAGLCLDTIIMMLRYYVQYEERLLSKLFLRFYWWYCMCMCIFFSSLVNFSEYILVYFENMNVVLLFASFYFLWEGELINELFINLPYIFNVLNCVSVFYSGNTLHSDTHYTAWFHIGSALKDFDNSVGLKDRKSDL